MQKRMRRIKRALNNLGHGWARRQKVKHMARGVASSQRKGSKRRVF